MTSAQRVLAVIALAIGGSILAFATRRPPVTTPIRAEPAPSASPSPSTSISTVPSPSVSVAPTPSYDPAHEFPLNLASAKKGGGGCWPTATYLVPGKKAAIVTHTCKLPVDWTLADPFPEDAQELRVVGATPGNVESKQFADVDVLWASKTGLWDLRGDGTRHALALAHARLPGGWWGPKFYVAYRYENDTFVPDTRIPEFPERGRDIDGDHVPEFECSLISLQPELPACSATDDARAMEVFEDGLHSPTPILIVEGLERWDGTSYARDLASFQPWFRAKLAEARKAAAALIADADAATEDGGSRPCGRRYVQLAAALYGYSVSLGEDPTKAEREMDRFIDDAAPADVKKDWAVTRPKIIEQRPPLLARKL